MQGWQNFSRLGEQLLQSKSEMEFSKNPDTGFLCEIQTERKPKHLKSMKEGYFSNRFVRKDRNSDTYIEIT